MMDLSKFDKTSFTNTPFVKKVEKPWGYEIIFTPPHLPYAGKILHINSGKRISLQVHDVKQETQFLLNGDCDLIIDNQQGELVTIHMEKEKGYTIEIGQRHRLHARTDCDVIEASLPEQGTTFRLEDDYSRPDETEEMRASERENTE